MAKRPFRLLLGCSGSVAAVKVPDIIDCLLERVDGIEITLVSTMHAMHFFDIDIVRSKPRVTVVTDEDEWKAYRHKGDRVVHIDLRNWADAMVISPLDANTLGKIANGLCDNLLTCVCRAWDFHKPFLVCPAMNTFMWDHPVTAKQLGELQGWGIRQLPPVVKKLACGDIGCGAMAAVDTIVDAVVEIASRQPSSA